MKSWVWSIETHGDNICDKGGGGQDYWKVKVIFTNRASSKPQKLQPKYNKNINTNSNNGDLFRRCFLPPIKRLAS